MPVTVLLRYGEIALKGGNRGVFLEALRRNVLDAVGDLGPAAVRVAFGRLLVRIEAEEEAVVDRLRRVFGVVSLSPARETDLDPEAVRRAAVELAEQALLRLPGITTFKIDTRRADKRFPVASMDLSRAIGRAVQDRFPHLRARMQHPDLLVRIELRDRAYLMTDMISGPGGLPYGTGGRALALISGGIDSPVAAWYAARRGVVIVPVHFHSFPFTSERAKEKVVDLCRVLAAYTGDLELWVIHFTEIQRAIQTQVPEALRVIVMRRMMMRVCDALAPTVEASALITGESLGQVASQTLLAVAAIDAATTLPVLRPLIGADKTEITARAEAIGTYAISIRPYPDCCSLFLPAHPRTQPTLLDAARAEAALDVPALVEGALARSTRLPVGARRIPTPAG